MTGSGEEAARIPPGTRLNGIYRVERLLAVGGMGEVYAGRAVETGVPVAIKMIRPELAADPAILGLFRREALALHQIRHEAIVAYYVFSIDPDLNAAYLAMEFVPGRPLSDIVREGPQGFDFVRAFQKRVASGLQAAHNLGVIHRDVSSDNIILPDGDPKKAKIIDFGIAKNTLDKATIIGDGFAGKNSYVSPEQVGLFGGKVTPKSDVYSFGLVLVEALLGRKLDMGGNLAEVVVKREAAPDLTGVDRRLKPLLQRMLDPNPDNRPTMEEVAEWDATGYQPELGATRILTTPPGRAAAPQPAPQAVASAAEPARSRRLPLIVGGVGVSAVAAVAAALLLWPAGQPSPNGSPAVSPQLARTDQAGEEARRAETIERQRQAEQAAAEQRRLAQEQAEAAERQRRAELAAAEERRAAAERDERLRRDQAEAAERRRQADLAAAEERRQAQERADRDERLRRDRAEAAERQRQADLAAAEQAQRDARSREEQEAERRRLASLAIAEQQRLARERAEQAEREESARREQAEEAERRRQAEVEAARRNLQVAARGETNNLSTLRDCSQCPELVPIPEGVMQMGSNRDPAERPVRQIAVKPFVMSRYPVTNEQWGECVRAGACADLAKGDPRSPVNNLSFDDAQQYVAWLSRVTGRSYRLPTEAEWEYAARGGAKTRYWWGEEFSAENAHCRRCGPSRPDPPPVGAFRPNPFGLYDMTGSVGQWVADCWHKDYRGAPRDASAWTAGGRCREQVVRGGAWNSEPTDQTVSSRGFYDPGVRHPSYGLRVVRSP